MATSAVNLDTTQYVRVNAKLNPLILQAHRDSVRIVFSELKPLQSNTIFHLLNARDPSPFPIQGLDTNVWALAMTEESSLIVTEIDASAYFAGEQKLQITAFGELSTASPEPIVQIIATHGLTKKTNPITLNGGVASASGSELVVESGSNPLGVAAITSSKVVAYRPGQGAKFLMTGRFGAPSPNSESNVGPNNSTDGLSFGYENETFGIRRRHHGQQEIQELQITTAATGNETATVTIDGVGYPVAITAGAVQNNAREIADGLTATPQLGAWGFEQNDDTVVMRFIIAIEVTGAFSFSSTGAAQGTFTEIWDGKLPEVEFIQRSSWSVDTYDDLDPSKGNVYRIRLQYLGYGDIEFSIEDKFTGQFRTVHIIQYANTNTRPSLGNPALLPSITTQNLGNTTSVEVATSSMSAFNEGMTKLTENTRSIVSEVSSTTTETPVFSLRNRNVSATGTVNLAEIKICAVRIATDAAKGVILRFYKNGVLTNYNFDYVDKDQSISSIDTSATVVTGSPVEPLVAVAGVNKIAPPDLILNFGDTITISIQNLGGGGSASATITMVYQEDL